MSLSLMVGRTVPVLESIVVILMSDKCWLQIGQGSVVMCRQVETFLCLFVSSAGNLCKQFGPRSKMSGLILIQTV